MTVRLSPNFSLAEFTASETAARRGIDNNLPSVLIPKAVQTAEMLERIRAALSQSIGRPAPILLLSGYRSEALNKAVGGSARSDHLRAGAADWHCPAFGTPTAICKFLAERMDELGIGQLINEFPSASGGWVHTSQPLASGANRVLTITAAGVRQGVHA
jgi:hypothetical protein